jgi:hypothetical protein
MFHQHYITYVYIVLPKTCKIIHYWYHNICRFIVNYVIAVCLQDILVSAPWRWRDNNAETCRSYGKDSMYKLQNSAFVGVI